MGRQSYGSPMECLGLGFTSRILLKNEQLVRLRFLGSSPMTMVDPVQSHPTMASGGKNNLGNSQPKCLGGEILRVFSFGFWGEHHHPDNPLICVRSLFPFAKDTDQTIPDIASSRAVAMSGAPPPRPGVWLCRRSSRSVAALPGDTVNAPAGGRRESARREAGKHAFVPCGVAYWPEICMKFWPYRPSCRSIGHIWPIYMAPIVPKLIVPHHQSSMQRNGWFQKRIQMQC